MAAVAVLAVGAPSAPAGSKPVRGVSFDGLERAVVRELNAIRGKHGLRPLKLSVPLSRAADAHSRAMGSRGFFAHDSADGSAFWQRIKRFYGPGSFRTWTVGENLLWSTAGIDAPRALDMWMASPKHRENILARDWREIGISAVRVSAAPGVFSGRDVVIVTTDFGTRR